MCQYKMLYRPFGIGAQPQGAVKFTPADKATDGHHGIVEYEDELTEEDVKRYELERCKPALIGLFIHYDNGEAVNIQDLPKPEYEALLDQLHATRLAYITLAGRN